MQTPSVVVSPIISPKNAYSEVGSASTHSYLVDENESLRAELSKKTQEWQEAVRYANKLQTILNETEEQLYPLLPTIASVAQKEDANVKTIEKLKRSLKEYHAKAKRLQQENTTLVSVREKDLKELTVTIESQKQRLEQLNDTITEFKQQNASLQRNLELERDNSSKWKCLAEKQQTELKTNKELVVELERSLQDGLEKLSRTVQHRDQLSKKAVMELESSWRKRLADTHACLQEREDIWRKEKATLELELSRLKSRLLGETGQKISESKSIGIQVDVDNMRVQLLKKQMLTTQEDLKHILLKNEELSRALERQNRRQDELDRFYKTKIRELRNNTEQLREKLTLREVPTGESTLFRMDRHIEELEDAFNHGASTSFSNVSALDGVEELITKAMNKVNSS